MHIALKWNPQHAVRSKDLRAGGIHMPPRIGYRPLTHWRLRGIQILQEASPVHDILPFPRGLSRHRCGKAAAAAHAIDTARWNRATTLQPTTDDVDAESKVLHAPVSHYPTPLNAATANETFPWQQAAVGHGASLTTIYGLCGGSQPWSMPVISRSPKEGKLLVGRMFLAIGQ
jgi:hypothetical protein